MNTNKVFYYGVPDGNVQGPLALASIEAAVSAGRLPADVLVSEDQGGPWRVLTEVMPMPVIPPEPEEEQVIVEDLTLQSVFRVLGWVMIVVAVLAAIATAIQVMNDTLPANARADLQFVAWGSLAIFGMLFLALAKGLDLLTGIYEELRK